MTTIESRIRAFVNDEENLVRAYALLKVGVAEGDTAIEAMRVALASALFDFHGIPFKSGES